VILDNHNGSLQPKDTSSDDTLQRLGAAWDRLASRYAIFTPDLMFFEALNEPAFTDGRRWEPWQRDLLAHIRAVAPNHTVLLTASPDSTPGALAGLTPVPDANAVYVFHFYTPMLFTHQGAEWASPSLESVRRLEYPAETKNVASVKARAATSYREALTDYLTNYSDTHALRGEIDVGAAWARSNRVRLIVTEFGVYNGAAPLDARAAWLRDVRETLERRSIGWTAWEYRGGFGVASDLKKPCGAPASVRAALGFCSPDRDAGRPDASPASRAVQHAP